MSPECNLACSYCNLAKAKEKSDCCGKDNYLFKNTIQSIDNGEYLNNIKILFNKFDQSPKNIELFEIWGQEPTLILSHLTPKWQDWNEYFPNIKKIGFSTNGVGYTNELIEFVKKLDETATSPLGFEIQYSYDGPCGEEEARGFKGNYINIIDNLLKFIEGINLIHFKHLNIILNLHTVLSSILLDNLDSLEKIDNYFKEYDKVILKIKESIINKNINFISADVIMQNCGKFTTEHGMDLLKFVNSLNRLKDNNKYEFFKFWEENSEVARMLFGVMAKDAVEAVINSPCRTLGEFTDYFAENKNVLHQACMCSSLTSFLRVSYDGCSYDCHASIYDNHTSKEKLDQTIRDQSRYSAAKHNRYINLLTDSDEEIDKIIQFYHDTHSNSITLFMYHNLINQIYMLALAGQADRSYLYDFDKLKKHAFIMARNNQCYDGLKTMNGSIFLRGNEEIRQICNGVLDIICQTVEREIDRFYNNNNNIQE